MHQRGQGILYCICHFDTPGQRKSEGYISHVTLWSVIYHNVLFFRCTLIFVCQNLYKNFLHEFFFTISNYSNRAVIQVNHTKNFYTKNFIAKKKAKYVRPAFDAEAVQPLVSFNSIGLLKVLHCGFEFGIVLCYCSSDWKEIFL